MERAESCSRQKKSVKLNDELKIALAKHVKKYDTLIDAAISLKVDRPVLERVLLKGSCSVKTFEKIKENLK